MGVIVRKSTLFGHYLLQKGIIKFNDIIEARLFQMMHNKKIGELAVEKNWLSKKEEMKILVLQEEYKKKYGVLASEWEYLKEDQLKELLKKQDAEYIFFGEALVRCGIISEEEKNNYLKEFEEIKSKIKSEE